MELPEQNREIRFHSYPYPTHSANLMNLIYTFIFASCCVGSFFGSEDKGDLLLRSVGCFSADAQRYVSDDRTIHKNSDNFTSYILWFPGGKQISEGFTASIFKTEEFVIS
jgi:hypothetical protein